MTRRTALAAIAGAAVTTPALAQPTADPHGALLEAWRRADTAAQALYAEIDCAADDDERWTQHDALESRSRALFAEICRTPARTIAGAAAQAQAVAEFLGEDQGAGAAFDDVDAIAWRNLAATLTRLSAVAPLAA